MSDPVLAAHRILPRVYQLSHPFSPISIKDQLSRAILLAQRLIREKELLSGSRVLIVGAGATGVEIALNLCASGISVVLLEKGDRAFATQLNSATRWLDPCQYDWPGSHFQWGESSPTPFLAALKWKAGYSAEIAAKWTMILEEAEKLFGDRLTLAKNSESLTITPIRKSHQFRIRFKQHSGKSTSTTVDTIIYATGFGSEQHFMTVDGKRKCIGPAFWGNDTLREPQLGKSTPSPRLLILGSGDGALQDFLRATTRLNAAHQIYDLLAFPPAIGRLANDIETQFHRSLIWMKHKDQEHSIYENRHNAYNDLVENVWPQMKKKSLPTLFVRLDLRGIYLAYPCNHFTAYYGLNCFLALLVAKAWQEVHEGNGLGAVLRPGLKAKDIAHEYQVNGADGRPPDGTFDVTFTKCKCYCAGTGKDNIEAEIVVPRFGNLKPAELDSLWPNAAPINPDRTRHLFPYFLNKPIEV